MAELGEEKEVQSMSMADVLAGREVEREVPPSNAQETSAKQKDTKEGDAAGDTKEPDAGETGDLSEEQEAALQPHEKGWYRSMKAERTKRQEAEQRGKDTEAAMRAEIEALRAQGQRLLDAVLASGNAKGQMAQPETPPPPASFWDDPEAFIKAQIQGVAGQISDVGQAAQRSRLDTLEMMARQRHADYDTHYQTFAQAAQANPAIIQTILQQPDPSEAAYLYGKRLQETRQISDLGGIDAYRAKMREELLAEIKQEQEAANAEAAIQQQTTRLPRGPADLRSAGAGMKAQPWNGPPDLKDVLGARR